MTWVQRSLQIWQVLIGSARYRQHTPYDELRDLIGFPGLPHWLATPLGIVMRYCRHHRRPPLTALVINGGGSPGDGLTTVGDLAADTEAVFAFPWHRLTPIGLDDLMPFETPGEPEAPAE
jgi:hypothetical protein